MEFILGFILELLTHKMSFLILGLIASGLGVYYLLTEDNENAIIILIAAAILLLLSIICAIDERRGLNKHLDK
jgi:hypothetical protein